MKLRVARVAVGALLVLSGALMYAASWQRWGGACSWGQTEGGGCDAVQDHRYDFVAPGAPWEPVGNAAELAGTSLLVLALALVLLPWVLTGRRPGFLSTAALVAAVPALGAVGVATLRSGLTSDVVRPFPSDLALTVAFLVPPVLLIRWAVAARGWVLRAGSLSALLATPLVASFSYAIGPYDTQPWWEAFSGMLLATSGLCLFGVAAFGDRSWARRTQWSRASIDSAR
jgi:hypothetical protein